MLKKLLYFKYYILLFLISDILIISLISFNSQKNIDNYLSQQMALAQLEHDTIYKQLKTQSLLIFQEKIDNETIISLYKEAYGVSKEKQLIIRQKMHEYLLPTYNRLHNLINLRQLHFHLPDNKSFLRMHQFSKFGDDLSDFRPTVAYVNKHHKTIDSFEEGRLYNGFRFLYPLFDKQKNYIGSVEISFSAQSFLNTLGSPLHFSEFIIDKELVDLKVWKNNPLANYVTTPISPNFLLEEIPHDEKYFQFRKNIAKYFKKKHVLEFHNKVKTQKNFTLNVKLDSSMALIVFIPIKNRLTNRVCAYLSIVTKNHYIPKINQETLILQFFVSALLFTLFLMFIYRHQYQKDKLKNENITKELQERINLAVSANNDGVWEWDILSNFAYFSVRWKEMLGYSDEELPNDPSSYYDNLHPDDATLMMVEIKKCQEDIDYSLDVIFRMKHKDNHWVWILSRGQTFYNKDKKAVRMIGTHTDISEEKNLQIKYAQQANIIDQMHDSVVTTDLQGNVLSWNHASEHLFGYSKDEMIGQNITILQRPQDREHIEENFNRIGKDEQFQEEFILITSTGETVSTLTRSSLFYDDRDSAIGILHYSTDMTEYNKIKKELETKQILIIQQARLASMGEMIGNIAHQWRQPLNALGLVTQKIQFYQDQGRLNDSIIKESVDKSMQLIDKMSHTIDDFRNFFNPYKQKEAFLILDAIESAYSIIELSMTQHNIQYKVEVLAQNIVLNSYRNELSQVIINLFTNAKDAFIERSIKDPLITLTIDKIEDKVILKICDNAGGIDDDVLPKIFDPYFTTKKEGKGTGIGLYMSKTIIEDHMDGQLHVENSSEGSCFILTFEN